MRVAHGLVTLRAPAHRGSPLRAARARRGDVQTFGAPQQQRLEADGGANGSGDLPAGFCLWLPKLFFLRMKKEADKANGSACRRSGAAFKVARLKKRYVVETKARRDCQTIKPARTKQPDSFFGLRA